MHPKREIFHLLTLNVLFGTNCLTDFSIALRSILELDLLWNVVMA